MITPNQLTYLRFFLALLCPILLILTRNPISDILVLFFFILACVTDWWDGYLARKYSMETGTGKTLDPIADKILILGLISVFMYLGLYSFWWIFFILAREISVTATRLIRLRKGQIIPAEWAGKVKIGFQIGSVCASLLLLTFLDFYIDKRIPDFYLFLNFLNYLGILLANIFTIGSGFLFFKRLFHE